MQRVISAGIIVFRRTKDGIKYLFIYQGRNYWNFPKGKIESEETSWQAAVRETSEETGLQLKELKFVNRFKAYERFVYQRGKEKISKVVILYLAETEKSHIAISGYHEGYAWFTYREAKATLPKRYKDSLKILEKAHALLRTVQRARTRKRQVSNKKSAATAKKQSHVQTK